MTAQTIVETERLLVRPWRLDDVEDAYAMYGDPEVTRTLPDTKQHTSIEESRAHLAALVAQTDPASPLGEWAVVEKESGQVVGGALLNHAPINGGNPVEIGYYFARSRWGRGYATEVARALVAHGLEHAGLDEILGVIVPGNVASGRVLEKAGMRHEGRGDYAGWPVEVYRARRG